MSFKNSGFHCIFFLFIIGQMRKCILNFLYFFNNYFNLKVAPYSYSTVQTGIYTDQTRVEFSRLGKTVCFFR